MIYFYFYFLIFLFSLYKLILKWNLKKEKTQSAFGKHQPWGDFIISVCYLRYEKMNEN